jgi:hypothetical protein
VARRFAPSLVVTISAVACSDPRARPSTEPPANPTQVDRVDHQKSKLLNPRHDKHGVIYVGGAHCYVHVPFDDPPKSWQPPKTKKVDCPVELDDPAWDSCRGGQLYSTSGDAGESCVCSQDGNPPPPPHLATCPKKH